MLTMRPRAFGTLEQISEDVVMQRFTYVQNLLTPPAGVAKQRLVVTVDGVEQPAVEVGADATSIEFKAGPAGAVVGLSLDYLDAAGNDSDNLSTEFTVEDKVAPAMPEGFGELQQTAEENVDE